jgi:adenylosuccinate lyase
LDRIEPNEATLRADLESHWEIVAEGAQTILRAAGVPNAYDILKSLTRGKSITATEFEKWIKALPVDGSVKARLSALSPNTYIGLAERIVEIAISEQ